MSCLQSAGTRTFKPNTYGYKGNALSSEEFTDFISKNEICDFYIAGADAV